MAESRSTPGQRRAADDPGDSPDRRTPLHKLGHLEMPLPHLYDARFAQAVRAFQQSTGLPADGILGPRTTLALSRVVAGAIAPSIAGEPSR